MTKIEEAAAALYAKFESYPAYARVQMNAALAEDLTRTVVEAMREPSEAMSTAGTHSIRDTMGLDNFAMRFRKAHQAAIDAALSEPSKTDGGG